MVMDRTTQVDFNGMQHQSFLSYLETTNRWPPPNTEKEDWSEQNGGWPASAFHGLPGRAAHAAYCRLLTSSGGYPDSGSGSWYLSGLRLFRYFNSLRRRATMDKKSSPGMMVFLVKP